MFTASGLPIVHCKAGFRYRHPSAGEIIVTQAAWVRMWSRVQETPTNCFLKGSGRYILSENICTTRLYFKCPWARHWTLKFCNPCVNGWIRSCCKVIWPVRWDETSNELFPFIAKTKRLVPNYHRTDHLPPHLLSGCLTDITLVSEKLEQRSFLVDGKGEETPSAVLWDCWGSSAGTSQWWAWKMKEEASGPVQHEEPGSRHLQEEMEERREELK